MAAILVNHKKMTFTKIQTIWSSIPVTVYLLKMLSNRRQVLLTLMLFVSIFFLFVSQTSQTHYISLSGKRLVNSPENPSPKAKHTLPITALMFVYARRMGSSTVRLVNHPNQLNKCKGWAHQLVKVDSHVGTEEGGGCDCFKYECHKKSL